LWPALQGLLSTPAVSAILREKGPTWQKPFGAFILTASHNPGGPEEDFGIKFNCENGGPAPETLTGPIYAQTLKIQSFRMAMCFPDVDIGTVGTTTVAAEDGSGSVIVDVIDAVADHVALLKTVFDFEAIKALATHPEFSIVYDCMHGVQGPYAKACLVDELGFPESSLMNAEPKDDFAGHHADPNLTYAAELTVKMGVDKAGQPVEGQDAEPPCFGAAADGDADRNMILGRRFFCSPSDSLAVIAAHANCIPYFRDQGGLKTVARSMPTSGAVDLVAKRLNFNLFETPVCGPRTPPACSARGQSLLGY
jgi:phosphoglucomutase